MPLRDPLVSRFRVLAYNASPMAENRAYISSSVVLAYLEELSRLGIYGQRPGSVATFIVRQEIMRLVEKGVIDRIKFVETTNEGGED